MAMTQVVVSNQRLMEKIRALVGEKKSSTELRSIDFCTLDQICANPPAMIQQLIDSAIATDPNGSKTLNLILVCDGAGFVNARDNKARERIGGMIRGIKTGGLGLHSVVTTLIWMTEEHQIPREERRESLAALGRAELDIMRVILLTNKHSNLTKTDEDKRIRAAALLICAYDHLVDRHVGAGLYTVGIGNQKVSETELAQYTRTTVAEAICNPNLRFALSPEPDMRQMCKAAFDRFNGKRVDILTHLSAVAEQACSPDFCFVAGRGDNVSGIPEDGEGDREIIEQAVTAWSGEMRAMMARMLTPEMARDFFQKPDYFEAMVNEQRARFNPGSAGALKVPLFASGKLKLAVDRYRAFVETRGMRRLDFVRQFCNRWMEEREDLERYAAGLIGRRDSLLGGYIDERPFMARIEAVAPETVHTIRDVMARVTLPQAKLDQWLDAPDNPDKQLSPAVLDKLMEWAWSQIPPENTADPLAGLAQYDTEKMRSVVLEPVAQQASVQMACLQHDKLPEIGEIFYFFPGTCPIDVVRRIRVKQLEPDYISVLNGGYQNVEAIALVRLAGLEELERLKMEENLTAFAAEMDLYAPVAGSAVQPAQAAERTVSQAPGQNAPAKAEPRRTNPWGLRINGQTVTFNWPDRSIKEVSVYLDDQQVFSMMIGSIAYRGEIQGAIPPGNHVLLLVNPDNGDTLDSLEFLGRRTEITYTKRKEKDITLAGSVRMRTYELCVENVKGPGDPVPPPFDLLLMRNNACEVALCAPQSDRHAPYTWFVAEVSGAPYELDVAGEVRNQYAMIRK